MSFLLALDFDGVLWDSVGECYQVAIGAYQQELPEGLEPAFRRGRWLIRCGPDFYVLLRLLEQDPERDLTTFNKDQFARLGEQWKAEAEEFGQRFYDLRRDLRDNDFEIWSGFQRPYSGFLEQLPRLKKLFPTIAICTTKDEDSVRQLLATQELELPVYGRDFSVDKERQIRAVAERFNVAPVKIFFIDDLMDNLHQVKPTGAQLMLADWGYNTPQEQEAADEEGIPVVSLTGLADRLAQLQTSLELGPCA